MHDQSDNKFYITTPIYYVTARPHLGTLYSTLLADVLARWHRLKGIKTFFLTGTDEHGQKIAQAAEKAGKQPKEFVDSFIDSYQKMWAEYELAYDRFIRTTDSYHVKAVQDWITHLLNKGDIYKSFYEGWYCTSCETFVTEKDAEHTTASSGPKCPTCGRETHIISEEAYFFKLSAYQDRLLKLYADNPDFIIPKERAHEVINFVHSGLKDLSISRTTITWGIPFPGDTKHVTYVWADALNNYITAVGYGQPERKKEFAQWWPADVHVLGKDIIRFHAVYWPAFLMASDLPLPKHLLVHGWIRVDQQKMSKSSGNAVDPQALYDTYGAEPVRYYLMRQMAITHDGDFSIEDLEQRISSDLANDLGNLLNRMSSLAHKHGLIDVPPVAVWEQAALDLRDECWSMLEEVEDYMSDFLVHMALARAWKFINTTNAYFHAQEPWKLAHSNPALFAQVISATCHSLRAIASVLWPVMPRKMEELLTSINAPLNQEYDTLENLELGTWDTYFMIHHIPPLFKKPEPKEPQESKMVEKTSEQANHITIDDFTKVELLVGTIEQCEVVPQSEKLYKLQVNFGDKGMRQILSGVRASFSVDDLVHKQGVFVFNLKPRMMLGMPSEGMMLFANGADGAPKLVTVAVHVPNGTRLK